MKMYKVSLLGLVEITEYEVVKTTEKSVWFRHQSYHSEEIERQAYSQGVFAHINGLMQIDNPAAKELHLYKD